MGNADSLNNNQGRDDLRRDIAAGFVPSSFRLVANRGGFGLVGHAALELNPLLPSGAYDRWGVDEPSRKPSHE
jgi:hypothetical protein